MAIIEDLGIEELTAGQQIVFAHTANNVSGVLAVACGSSDTTIVLSPGGGALFPNAPFYCSIEFEVVWCLSKSGDSFIVQRGMDGTAATTHAVGNSVEMRNNAGLWTDAYNAINAVSTDVGNLATGITNKTALPPDVTYQDNVQSLTHKTIDLTDPTKANVIIGTVQPDPASLPLQNILTNGGFEEWSYTSSLTLAAGTPTSGGRAAFFCNSWQVNGINDSAITVTRDTANPDPGGPSGTDLLLNITTVQGSDFVGVYQTLDGNGGGTDISDIKKLVGASISASARIKLISGNLTFRLVFSYFDGAAHDINGPITQVTSTSYATFKFENQIVAPNQATTAIYLSLKFQGVGQVSVDNVMMNVGATAVGYRPRAAVKVAGPNLLANGGFEIWQRGAGPFGNTNLYSADKWNTSMHAGESVNKETSLVDNSPTSAKIATSGSSNPGSPTQVWNSRILESVGFKGKTFTFSGRVLINVASMVRLCIWDGVTAVYSAYHPGDSIWRTLTLTATLSPSATEFSVCFQIEGAGVTYLDNAMVVPGAVAAEYVPLHPADELARCLRYYEVLGANFSGTLGAATYQAPGQVFQMPVYYKTSKPVAPTVTRVGVWGVVNCGQPVIGGTSLTECNIYSVCTSLGYMSFLNNATNTSITIEANP